MCYLRQEVVYFDLAEDTSGSICARLSSDALAIQQITGKRLGIVCETLAMLSFGLILGLQFNWQLTVIILSVLVLDAIILYLNIRYDMRSKKESSIFIGHASSVSFAWKDDK